MSLPILYLRNLSGPQIPRVKCLGDCLLLLKNDLNSHVCVYTCIYISIQMDLPYTI